MNDMELAGASEALVGNCSWGSQAAFYFERRGFDFGADSRSRTGLPKEALRRVKGHTCFLFHCFDSG